ncbi:hypothetical protein GCM10025868_37160 [Angustibacter aerolatus]|uniref:LysM domain-containing protein n=1 Tax=Angustibacter aerolatus TaxID=1162965 RepID=A0ABQ6JJN4_9ACTN|nr:hypothetical protein GCM10025868_37160 [Angustibacter aerolatus]
MVVRRGDSLWAVAARHLGRGADDVEVLHAWPRWWHTNRDVIGDDPDRLQPGTVLRVPSGADESGTETTARHVRTAGVGR